MKRGIKIELFLLCLLTSTVNTSFSADAIKFVLTEVSEYQYQPQDGSELLQMDYASHIIRNPEAWDNSDHRKKIVQVDIVFTKYPYYKKDWITNYDTLLNNRIRSICHLDPGINIHQVRWNLVIQTQCRTEEEAKELFHGAVIWYEEVPVLTASNTLRNNVHISRPAEVKASSDIGELMSRHYRFPDSTIFKVLERNDQWDSMLVVNDWTASMYQYGAQAVLWHEMNLTKKKVSGFVFFNDGDKKTIKRIGKTGGIYFGKPDNISNLTQLMKKVQRKGTGGDSPENDIEALLKAIDKIPAFKELILIADNRSAVKDMALLKELNVPVRVIVCGCKKGQTIRHDYLQIASHSNGSVHTMEGDAFNLSEVREGEKITIMEVEYQRTKGRLVKAKQKVNKSQL